MDILDFMKIKNLCAKDSVKKVKKTTHRKGKNFWQIISFLKELYIEYIKNYYNQMLARKPKWAKALNRHFST